MKPSDTWVCVADGERAQFFQCDGGRDLEPVIDFCVPRAGQGAFAGRLAGQLDRAARGHRFEHLVLVGPKAFLRELEDTMAPATRELIVADVVDTNLARATPREAGIHLSSVLPH
ncbi:MAG: host attachment protein [Pseudomonadota bacterium]